MNKKSLHLWLTAILAVSASTLNAQTSGNWPDVTVAFYDCNYSTASVDNSSQLSVLHTASGYIYRELLRDTSLSHLEFYTCGLTDSLVIDSTLGGFMISFQDSVKPTDADYVIASTITGSSGNYTLTVSIVDGQTLIHVIDGTAKFSSITDNEVKNAASSAVSKIVPVLSTIRNYQELLKNNDPALCINPHVDVTTGKSVVPLNGSTIVTITVTDCDGLPVPGQRLSLDAEAGTLSSSALITNNSGSAAVTFFAGKKDDIGSVTAAIDNAITVTHDTLNPCGSLFITVGSPDTASIGVLEFDITQKSASYSDKIGDGTWDQSTKFSTYSYQGKCKGSLISFMGFAMFVGDTAKGSGSIFKHTFAKHTVFERGSNPCPKILWSMSGSTSNGTTPNKAFCDATINYSTDPLQCGCTIMGIRFKILKYSYNWRDEGHVRNANCEVEEHIDQSYSEEGDMVDVSKTNGESGLIIYPFTQRNGSTAYTIMISDATSNPDGSYSEVTCNATLKPYSSNNNTAVEVFTSSPAVFSLFQNYPNPFNPTTTIGYSIQSRGNVTLKVYDVLGREVKTLVNERQNPGIHTVNLDSRDLPSGVYFYRIVVGSYTSVRKMLLLK
jgi:hypothetical protein